MRGDDIPVTPEEEALWEAVQGYQQKMERFEPLAEAHWDSEQERWVLKEDDYWAAFREEVRRVGQTDEHPVVYLSGPMTGHPDYNFPAFVRAAERLAEDGYDVRSPAQHDLDNGFDPASGTFADGSKWDTQAYQRSFRWDVETILASDYIVVLPGWQDSRGATLEVELGRAIGLPILEYPGMEPVEDDAPRQTHETILQEAQRLIYGDRQRAYGHPLDDFTRTGRMWGAILGIPDVPPELVGLCMTAVKVSREVNRPKRDNLTDVCGYAGTVAMIHEERERRAGA